MKKITPKIDFQKELKDLFGLRGKVAYLPGGYGGLGEAFSWGLAMHGAKVVIAGRTPEKAEALVNRIVGAGYEAESVFVDAESIKSIGESVDEAAGKFGGIDILVNCIGHNIIESMMDVTEKTFDEAYQINLKPAMFFGQHVARQQIKAGRGGKQIHLLSVRSQLAIRDKGYSGYCANKGGMRLLVQQHAMELAPHGICVNGLAPTFVHTEMIQHAIEDKEFYNNLTKRIPLGRVADPQDMVGTAIFLASSASDFITGQTIFVDGGITTSQ